MTVHGADADAPVDGGSRHSNPDWTWDEQILAFDLYHRVGMAGRGDPEVIALSGLLHELPIHPLERRRNPTFRNPNGVARKLADIGTRDPHNPPRPQTSGSRLDREVWERYGDNPAEAATIAAEIRRGIELDLEDTGEEEEAIERPEGRIVYRLHRRIERDRTLVRRKKAAVLRATGALACEACSFDFATRYGDVGEGFAEVHHVRPLHLGATVTRTDDLVVLCANCHRIAHRMEPLPTLEELRATVR